MTEEDEALFDELSSRLRISLTLVNRLLTDSGPTTINGAVCDLSVRNVVNVAGLGVGRYRFMVELQNSLGALFELGQCCTDASDGTPPRTQFAFLVEWVDGSYLVMTAPPYSP